MSESENVSVDTEEEETFLDIADFNSRVVGAYNDGSAELGLDADIQVARSIVPAGTGALRDFSYIAPDLPEFYNDKCVGCMDCVTECPDTAILGIGISESDLEKKLNDISDPEEKKRLQARFSKTKKFHGQAEKKGIEGAMFGIFVDPTKCKGCGECVEVCGSHESLGMVSKDQKMLEDFQQEWDFYKTLPETPDEYVNEKFLADMMLTERSLLYVGGAGSCMGCGEATALRMMTAATGFTYGKEGMGIVASTGCNTVYTSTYPYNPYIVPWTNSLFENGPAVAMGVRARWDQEGMEDKRLWVIGGDGAMLDIGFQSLSRMLASGVDIKVLVLDTQVYSNTGGQASTSSYGGQDAKMSQHGKVVQGKTEARKELSTICLMHGDVYVSQTTCAHVNHFYRSIMEANEFPGPAVINVFTTCQPEHGVADDMAGAQAKLAADSRAFPVFTYDPRRGNTIKERMNLTGNPSPNKDWYVNPKTKEEVNFIDFARTEGRFAKQFDKDGNPSEVLLATNEERLKNWHRLQELAGLR